MTNNVISDRIPIIHNKERKKEVLLLNTYITNIKSFATD